MSIQSDLETFSSTVEKIKARQAEIKELNKIKFEAEKRIQEYLISKNQPGVIYKGHRILLDEKLYQARETKEERTARLVEILRRHGVIDPETAIEELKPTQKVKKNKLIFK